MSIWEIFKISTAALRGNKLRSLLTALGIIIGVGAVIAMISIGQGASKEISDRISAMGSNLIMVMPMRGTTLTVEDAEDLLERVPTISAAVPSISTSITAKWQDETYDTTAEGANEAYPAVRNVTVKTGRFITAEEVDSRARVAVIGQTVVDELFQISDPLGQKITINGQSFTVIGILAEKGSSMGANSDDLILIPISTAQRLAGATRVNTIYLQATSAKDAELAVAHITAIFTQKHKREDTVRVTSQDELLETVSSTTQTFTIMLGAIAGISLLVGGIGIMNIMLVSVTERTREIGIRKALGAKKNVILAQFIVESVLLSVIGGIIGIASGIGIARLVTVFSGMTTVLSPVSIAVSFLFAFGVGLFFGVYPAYKAASLDPIVALRHE
ncbi:MAG: ABC transporter permease [Clostridia bacterium]|jgi:putative ABC transport system permease protein|nr:ABC transporter permease [Clostridia bacterium]